MAAPVLSVTVPRREAVPVCAQAPESDSRNKATPDAISNIRFKFARDAMDAPFLQRKRRLREPDQARLTPTTQFSSATRIDNDPQLTYPSICSGIRDSLAMPEVRQPRLAWVGIHTSKHLGTLARQPQRKTVGATARELPTS